MKLNINDYNWEEVFVYDENSPSGLLHKSDNSTAGGIDEDVRNNLYKRWRVGKFSKQWLVHRIIWVMHNAYLDDQYEIDHKDGNALNNKIDNLRKIPKAKNRRNSSKRKDNTSGYTGISIQFNGYRAFVKVQGKDKSKFFAWLKHGKDEALTLALEWRINNLEILNQQGAGYTDRHGT